MNVSLFIYWAGSYFSSTHHHHHQTIPICSGCRVCACTAGFSVNIIHQPTTKPASIDQSAVGSCGIGPATVHHPERRRKKLQPGSQALPQDDRRYHGAAGRNVGTPAEQPSVFQRGEAILHTNLLPHQRDPLQPPDERRHPLLRQPQGERNRRRKQPLHRHQCLPNQGCPLAAGRLDILPRQIPRLQCNQVRSLFLIE